MYRLYGNYFSDFSGCIFSLIIFRAEEKMNQMYSCSSQHALQHKKLKRLLFLVCLFICCLVMFKVLWFMVYMVYGTLTHKM